MMSETFSSILESLALVDLKKRYLQNGKSLNINDLFVEFINPAFPLFKFINEKPLGSKIQFDEKTIELLDLEGDTFEEQTWALRSILHRHKEINYTQDISGAIVMQGVNLQKLISVLDTKSGRMMREINIIIMEIAKKFCEYETWRKTYSRDMASMDRQFRADRRQFLLSAMPQWTPPRSLQVAPTLRSDSPASISQPSTSSLDSPTPPGTQSSNSPQDQEEVMSNEEFVAIMDSIRKRAPESTLMKSHHEKRRRTTSSSDRHGVLSSDESEEENGADSYKLAIYRFTEHGMAQKAFRKSIRKMSDENHELHNSLITAWAIVCTKPRNFKNCTRDFDRNEHARLILETTVPNRAALWEFKRLVAREKSVFRTTRFLCKGNMILLVNYIPTDPVIHGMDNETSKTLDLKITSAFKEVETFRF